MRPLSFGINHLKAAFDESVLRNICRQPGVWPFVDQEHSPVIAIKTDDGKADGAVARSGVEEVTAPCFGVCVAVAEFKSQAAVRCGTGDAELNG